MIKTCSCGKTIARSTVVDGKRHQLKNRSRCLDCVPFLSSVYRVKKTPEEIRSKNAEKAKRCHTKRRELSGLADPIGQLAIARKGLVIALVDGCQLCGYNKCQRNLLFHHLRDKADDPSIKMFQKSFDNVMAELKKCMLVCHNCHGEIHDGLIDAAIIKEKHHEFVSNLETLQAEQWTIAYARQAGTITW